MPITHKEVRRHPIWRAELTTPTPTRPRRRFSRSGAIVIGALVLVVAVGLWLFTRS